MTNKDSKGKLAVGFPLYHQVPASFFSRWLGMDKAAVTSTIVINGAYILLSMESIIEQALALDNWERLVIFEHDMLPPADAFKRIANYSKEHAVVGSMYFGHHEPHTAIVYIEQEDNTYAPITPQTVADWTNDPALHQCGAVGFGFTSIARHVLEDWDPKIPMFGQDERLGSHDIWFCEMARKQGYKVYVDSGIVCEHLTEVGISLSHNQDKSHMIDGAKILDFNYDEDA